ncbi:glycosyltransferase family 87 protein [Tomitella gaofuii]|uniref:glycosyltransferase family 87 protein n=1 Tax=Tomitella gaofuii TaxID=2760083 RepID=UPI002E2DFA9E|nr:glycosyltransferase family 87 protein [Tomitella gaofuii]
MPSTDLLLPRTAWTRSAAIKAAMWPIAVFTVLHRVLSLAVQGAHTDDFNPVYDAAWRFWQHLPIYGGDLDTVTPHYLYPPGGTLLLSPLGLINYEWSRWLFIAANTVAIIIAGYLLLRLFDYGIRSVAAPVLLFAMFFTETVSNTLIFSNVNGIVLLCEVLFLTLMVRGHHLWAGVPMGLTIAIKPVLAPILLLPLLKKQWRPFVAALGIPLILNAAAWPLITDSTEFINHTLPYLTEARDYFNSALVGAGAYFGVAEPLVWVVRILLGLTVLVSLYLLFRFHRADERFYLCTGAGVLLTASFLLGSLGQQYYSMLVFPLMMTVVLRNSVVRTWPAWVAAYLFLSFDSWYSSRFIMTGKTIESLRATFGWALLLVVIFTVLLNRYLAARAQGRLDGGIDPLPPDGPARSADAQRRPHDRGDEQDRGAPAGDPSADGDGTDGRDENSGDGPAGAQSITVGT